MPPVLRVVVFIRRRIDLSLSPYVVFVFSIRFQQMCACVRVFLSLCFFSVPILNQRCFLGSHHVCLLVLPVVSSFL